MPLFRPAKPKIRVTLAADTAIAAGAQLIPFDTVQWTEGDIALNGAGDVTVNRPGLYLVQCSLSRQSGGTGPLFQLSLRLNGAVPTGQGTFSAPNPTTVVTYTTVAMIPAVAGDKIGAYCTLDSVSTRNARSIGTSLAIARIGPERWT